MKELKPPFSWVVRIHDFNADRVKPYDVLAHREDLIKKLKKKHTTIEDFTEAFDRDLRWHYLSRCEYEMILYVENERVYLEPWVGKFKDGRVDITDDKTLDWKAFAEKMLKEQGWNDKENNRLYVKFDIYDQLKFRFDELIEFVWNYRHKYQRTKKGN